VSERPDYLSRDAWIGEANCKGMDVNLFFPSLKEKYSPKAIDACASCPVIEPCQEWAIRYEGHGYQGGLTKDQRSRVRSKLGITLIEPQRVLNGTYTKKNNEINHGTNAGYKAETRKGISHCEPCREAHRKETARAKERRQAQRAQAS